MTEGLATELATELAKQLATELAAPPGSPVSATRGDVTESGAAAFRCRRKYWNLFMVH